MLRRSRPPLARRGSSPSSEPASPDRRRDRAAKALVDLLNVKETAQYGLIPITGRELSTALRRAKMFLDLAGEVLRG